MQTHSFLSYRILCMLVCKAWLGLSLLRIELHCDLVWAWLIQLDIKYKDESTFGVQNALEQMKQKRDKFRL